MILPNARLLSVSLAFATIVISTNVQAHFFSEAPQCKAPKKPLQFVTELDKKEFDQKVDEYRSCLEGFVERQNKAMEKHKVAADKAAEIWKTYAERELGLKVITVPADQEVPPAEANDQQPEVDDNSPQNQNN